jgi:hypothetical protein
MSERTTSDIDLTQGEKILDQVVVRVWRPTQAWILLALLPLLALIPIIGDIPILIAPITLAFLWYGTYFIRQRWRLTLTNRQIVARQLLPRPMTLLSPIHYFPLHNIEGLSIGPRAFRNILLIGVFAATNIGVTILKAGLTPTGETVDLPDGLEALFLFMRGVVFLPFLASWADSLETLIIDLLLQVPEFLIALGTSLVLLGILLIIATIPRRYHLQIRMRHSRDFRLEAGVPKSFWEACYQQMYAADTVSAPKNYRKWRYPWLEGEKAVTSADLEEVIYTNRFISVLAIYFGSVRLWNRATGQGLFQNDGLLWVIVVFADAAIAALSLYFSKKKNEMVVTNRRIIFAQEMRDISGAFGRRLYLMSDISRDDVAGFHILRIKGLSYRYLFLTVLSLMLTITYWRTLVLDTAGTFVLIILILATLIFAVFINQTYVQFDLRTKGNEVWHMRHQLANPLTFMRELVGDDENRVITTLMSNRLEEKEVADTMQIIRAGDTGLRAKLFEDTKYFGSNTELAKSRVKRTLQLDDLLLENEEVLYEANVSRGVPRRTLNLSIASLFVLGMGGVLVVPYSLGATPPDYLPLFTIFSGVALVVMVVAIWLLYYSLFRATIVITEKRIFFMDIKAPPRLLYLMGVTRVSKIEETLQSQIHSTYTSRMFRQQQYWRDLVQNWWRLILVGIPFGLSIAGLQAIYIYRSQYPDLGLLIPAVLLIIHATTLAMAWYLGNAYVAFIRSLPKRVVNTRGVGSHFTVPFASKEKTDAITQTVWRGVISGD